MSCGYRIKTLIIIFISAAMLFSCTFRASAGQRKLIVVVTSRAIPAYEEAYKGFREEIKKSPYKVVFIDYLLEEHLLRSEEELIEKIKGLGPDLLYTIGTEASVFINERVSGTPIVFSMVLDPEDSGLVGQKNITGSSLQIPAGLQFEKLKRAIPSIQTIGMLYDGRTKPKLLDEAQTAADGLSLRLIAIPVYNMGDISRELMGLFPKVDCLWAGLDTFIYNPTTGRRIILETLKSKVPFMSFSEHFVKAGALMALECDYYDIGVQSGELAVDVFKGKMPGITVPRKTKLIINKRTAEQIGVNFDKKILEKAELVR